MAALAGIGDMPDTIEDRAVIISMRRRAPDETVRPTGPAATVQPSPTSTDLHRWVRAHLDQLEAAAPDMPVEDRAADTWEPLVAIADPAGGDWPTNARAAVLALTADDVDVENVSLRVRLLIDCRTAFGDAERPPHRNPRRPAPRRPRSTVGHPRQERSQSQVARRAASRLRHPVGQRSLGRRQPSPRLQTRAVRRLLAPLLPRPQFHVTSAVPAVTASHERESVTAEPHCDGSAVPNPPIRHKSTLMGRRDGWDGKAQTTSAAVCISCRQPLSYDDGTHTHPTCNA